MPYILVAVIFGALVLGYITHGFKQFTFSSTPSPQSSVSEVQVDNNTPVATISVDIPADWKLFTSDYGYSLKYPTDIKTDTMAEGDRFYKLGPTQSAGTELYDGISLLIKSADLADLSLDQLVDQKYKQLKSEETTREITPIQEKKIGNHTVKSFHHTAFGDGEYIYIQMPNKQYLEIINMTVEPQNREQTFQAIVEKMIASITF